MDDSEKGLQPDWAALLSRQIALRGPLLFRVAFGVVRETSLAEDLVQQALLKAWEQRQTIQNADALKPWLLRSVVNGGLAVLRRRKIERRVLELHRGDEPFADTPQIQQAELRTMALNAVGDLPELTRAVVVLRVLEGMSGNEVKDLLDTSAAEVSRQLHSGLELLRSAIQR